MDRIKFDSLPKFNLENLTVQNFDNLAAIDQSLGSCTFETVAWPDAVSPHLVVAFEPWIHPLSRRRAVCIISLRFDWRKEKSQDGFNSRQRSSTEWELARDLYQPRGRDFNARNIERSYRERLTYRGDRSIASHDRIANTRLSAIESGTLESNSSKSCGKIKGRIMDVDRLTFARDSARTIAIASIGFLSLKMCPCSFAH